MRAFTYLPIAPLQSIVVVDRRRPSISVRAPSHRRATAGASSCCCRRFFSALGPESSARAGGPRPSSALARTNLVIDVNSGDLHAPGPDTHRLSARSSTSLVVAPSSIAVAGPPRRRVRPLTCSTDE
jgi:hypothetical protein